MPFGPDSADRARTHAELWADEETRVDVAREMYRIRLGGELPQHKRDLDSLRGIEGRRVKKVYQNLADQHRVEWNGRRYDRNDPDANDTINHAINHAVTAVYAASRIAVAVTGTVPELGFIHESSGRAFALDIADVFRSSTALPIAFRAAKKVERQPGRNIEPTTRKMAGATLRDEDVIPEMIDQIKEVLDVDDDRGDA
jgi:CRISPR-associated protein Cas1